ncbi:MAG: outer membrane protein assembly factor [Proteobacteria bacterium]|nr:outer membrane protein assembly factor [Pseudomonadota bacterium]
MATMVCRRSVSTTLLLCLIPCALAVQVTDVRIVGIAEPDASHNAESSVSLLRSKSANGGQMSEERLAFLLRKAPDEIRTALEPFGYYDAQVDAKVQRDGDKANVEFTVNVGAPVRVTSRNVAMHGAANADATVMRAVERFAPAIGEVLDHRRYEASKQDVERQLSAHGYFDAKATAHRVEVTRASHAAAVDVVWDSGARYRFGDARYAPNQFKPGLLAPLQRWQAGQPYRDDRLLEMQQALADLGYFGSVQIAPDIEQRHDGQVPITVTTTPAKRNVYSAGLSYGTDSGIGVTLGYTRRWLNRGGHTFDAQLEWAQNRKSLAARYRIPALDGYGGWYALSSNLKDEQTDAGHTRLAELIGSRSGRIHRWTLTAAFHVQRERYQDALYPGFDRFATLVFPSFSAQTTRSDDKLYPTRGWSLAMDASGGSTAIGSDVDFAQLHARASWVRSLGASNRLLLRGEIGRVFTGNFNALPPSLRYYAGGDASVRGYSYQEVGPRLNGQNVGAPNLVTASVEFEHRFTPTWGAAVFADDGDAFVNAPRSHLGVGIGLRWRSPVGPVRIDVAHGFQSASPVHLSIGIGSEL